MYRHRFLQLHQLHLFQVMYMHSLLLLHLLHVMHMHSLLLLHLLHVMYMHSLLLLHPLHVVYTRNLFLLHLLHVMYMHSLLLLHLFLVVYMHILLLLQLFHVMYMRSLLLLQVMYMYYLLGHRLMELPIPVERKEVIAQNTYLLTLDGDIDFQPHAVHLLIDLMKKNHNLGAACGRIHPVGTGRLGYVRFRPSPAYSLVDGNYRMYEYSTFCS